MNKQSIAQIWVGQTKHLVQETITQLQKIFCIKKGCGICSTCITLKEKQHHQLMWLNPEKQYSLSLLEPLFEKIAFANESNKPYFFILQKADTLTTTCANSLLKSVEEPPTGYNFIFLAERLHTIIPTIRSRCTVKTFNDLSPTTMNFESLYTSFIHKTDPLTFLQILDKNTPNEHDSLILIDALLSYFSQQYLKKNTDDIQKKILLLQTALKHSPMPGSSKIFWKNLFLQFT